MNDNSAADALYDRVMNVIGESDRMVDAPNVPDMTHIQTQVKQLCDEINALPVEERVEYADKFSELFEALSSLEGRLQSKRDEIAQLLSETHTHKNATNAYTKTDHIDQKPKK